MSRDVSAMGLLDWRPGDRYLYRPVGHAHGHWHEVTQRTRFEPGDDLPEIFSRCLARRSCLRV